MTDEELVLKLKLGSEEAFEVLYGRYASGLLRHLMHLMGNQQEAEELLHECMMLMIEKINFYSPNTSLKNSFKAWLYRLSTNRAIDEIRKRKGRMVELTEVASEEVEEDRYVDKERDRLIGDLVLKLPLMQRTVLTLRVEEDLSYMEISAILGKDINTIKQGLFQARKSMKRLLADYGEL